MFDLITQFGAEQSGIGALGVDGKAFIIQLITFILAILVLKKYAVGPIVKIMDKRRATIEKGVNLGEKMQKEQHEMEQKVAAAIADARKEADKIIAEASGRGREIVSEAETQAKTKAEAIVKSAEDRIVQDTKRARKQLEGELASLVSDATEAIVEEKVDAKKDAKLINKALEGAR